MIKYRAEIDGLRALAVCAVMLFHADFSTCGGGYTGVDVFFVISGYLITSIILYDQDAETFSLLRFYERRMRRILPALYFVLFCCLPLAYVTMLPYDLKQFAEDLVATTLCISNILFLKKVDYFTTTSALNPLIHTWSLAVEEQFYIFFSLFFTAFSKVRRRSILTFFVFTALLSLLAAQWSGNFQLKLPLIRKELFWFSQHKLVSFYSPIGRLWELLIGTLLAFYLHSHTLQYSTRNEIAAASGLGLILCAIFLFDKTTPSPSIYTIVPTVGTGLIILYGNEKTFVGKILSLKIFVCIGLCSYSAYLWHQPLLVFARLSNEKPLNISGRFSIIIIALILAYVSWKYIETPFRKKESLSQNKIFFVAFSVGLIINIIASYLFISGGLENRFSSNNAYMLEVDKPTAIMYWGSRFNTLSALSSFNETTNKTKLLILGDSYAADFLNMVVENDQLLNYQIRVHRIDSACQLYAAKQNISIFISAADRIKCYKQHKVIIGLTLIREANVIIMAFHWHMWSAQNLPETFRTLNIQEHQKTFVIGSKGCDPINPMLFRSLPPENRLQQRCQIISGNLFINTILNKIFNSTNFVNMYRLICDEGGTCPIFTPNGSFISFDGAHLTKSGAKFIGSIIFQNFPLKTLR